MHPNDLIQGFREAVEYCGLRDLRMEGYPFTWERSRGSTNWVEERLDRVMATQMWLSLFGIACIYNLEAPFSDHFALFLDFLVKRVKKTSRFRFKNAWIKEVECKEWFRVARHVL